ncbi:MAG: hypothetical protein J1E58_08195 [Prevotella sp.]|nr:hypothetical protein [Prevotella sp.]
MRKNIFSWKSLAGLTLLFGLTIGLSSCEQVEVDPNPSNPGQTEKPVEPSTGVNGASIVITAAKINQVNDSLYLHSTDAKYKGSLAEKFAKILADEDVEEITITVESAGLEMENGGKVTLPQGQNDRPFNLVFTSTFKKSVGQLVIEDKNSLHNLNITLPSGDFGKLKIDTEYSVVNVKSAGTTYVEFSSASNERAVTLGNGVKATIDEIDANVKGSEVEALIFKTSETATTEKSGVKTKVKNGNNFVYAKNLVIRGTGVTVSGISGKDAIENPLNKITVENNSTLTLNGVANEIIGVLDADGKINNTTVTVSTYSDNTYKTNDTYFKAIKKISNVTVTGDCTVTALPEISNSKLKFGSYNFSSAMTSVAGLEFVAKNTNTYFYINVPAQGDASSYVFSFSNAKFPTNSHFNIWDIAENPETDGNGDAISVTWYVWYEYDSNGNKIQTGTRNYDYWAETEAAINNYIEDNGIEASQIVERGSDVAKNPNRPYYVIYKVPQYKTGQSQVWEQIPLYNRQKDATGGYAKGYWWTVKDEPTYSWYNNFDVVFKFDSCKYDGKALTDKTPAFSDYSSWSWSNGINVRYEIDGIRYRTTTGPSSGATILVKD